MSWMMDRIKTELGFKIKESDEAAKEPDDIGTTLSELSRKIDALLAAQSKIININVEGAEMESIDVGTLQPDGSRTQFTFGKETAILTLPIPAGMSGRSVVSVYEYDAGGASIIVTRSAWLSKTKGDRSGRAVMTSSPNFQLAIDVTVHPGEIEAHAGETWYLMVRNEGRRGDTSLGRKIGTAVKWYPAQAD